MAIVHFMTVTDMASIIMIFFGTKILKLFLLEVIKLLLEHGATPAPANERNYVPLDLARFNDNEDVAQYFLSFAGMLEKNNEEEGLSAAAEGVDIGSEEEKKQGESEKAT